MNDFYLGGVIALNFFTYVGSVRWSDTHDAYLCGYVGSK